jgi:cytochrome c
MTGRLAVPGIVAGGLCAILLGGCQRLSAYVPFLDEDAARGRRLAERYGCAACHEIPGAATSGFVGPTLRGIHRRAYLGGGIPNTPETLVEWIRFPERVRPGTLMPNLRVSEQDGRDLAAFLYTLR